jgi:hypothetical protein
MDALRLVFRNPYYVALGLASFLALAVLYLWESQVLIIGADGISWFVEPSFVAAALIMSLLFGLLLPLQLHAFRLAAASARQTGGTALGVLVGTASMTCCAPVLLPSILALLGFSGTAILGINGVLHRYWLPLATIGVVLLTYSLYSVIDSLTLACTVQPSDPESSDERGSASSQKRPVA